ncbi:MAG: hypothetical protein A4E42_00974 [Methanoregulaceae archaeon PtaU1.Bin222]|nr:MAG: hypothetical protein A4E42_00974 [Methanoregulaceae archaeon PtaU1.Bin222]
MTETAAPKAPALEIPRVKGEPSGFLSIDCMAIPATASPVPATMAESAWGRRMFQIIASHLSETFWPRRVWITSLMGMVTAPTDIEHTRRIKMRRMPPRIQKTFRRTYPR